MPKAPERRPSIEAVGLLSPRSILWIIAREAPARSARVVQRPAAGLALDADARADALIEVVFYSIHNVTL